jgi:hypothetical protein
MATITIEVSPEQWNRWRAVAGAKSDVAAFLIRSADFYAERLQARVKLAQRMQREGRL